MTASSDHQDESTQPVAEPLDGAGPPADASAEQNVEAPAETVAGEAVQADASAAQNVDAPVEVETPAEAETPAAADTGESEPVAQDADAWAEADTGKMEPVGLDAEATAEAEGGESADESPASEDAGASAEGDGSGDEKKKRRRRRRKKKKGEPGEGAEASPESEGPERERRDMGLPFARFFEGHGGIGKRHAFSVGEIVAGRVTTILEGSALVDLFGKAIAVFDHNEPREAPIHAEPRPVAPSPAAETAADGPETPPAAEPTPDGEVPAVVVAPTVTVGDVPTEQAPVASEPGPSTQPPPEEADERDIPEDIEELSVDSGEGTESQAGEQLAPEVPTEPLPEVGQIARGRVGAVAESGHIAIINRVVDRTAMRARLETARDERRRVWGVVFGFNRGGYDVIAEGIRVFCPASGMSLEPIEDPEALIGAKLEFNVPPRKQGASGVVVSRRTILEREARKARKHRLKSLNAGDRIMGRVTQVREFGVFVDLGDGLEGLVHQSELDWGRVVRPADVAKPGDEMEVEVLKAEGKDRQARVSLSRRTLLPDPFQEHSASLEEGSARMGRVVRTTDFGAFVELAPGIEGLLHISELGQDLKHASEAISEGEQVGIVIERVDRSQRRVSLSRLSRQETKALEEGTLDLSTRPKSLKPGSHVTVVVEKVEHAGMVVQVKGVPGRRGRGFLANRELGTKVSGDRRKSGSVGSELEVKIIGTDRDGGLRCSIKGLETDEERRAVRDYRKESAKQGLGTFGDLLRGKLADMAKPPEGDG